MASIRIISELYYPEQNATGYFLTGIAEGLVNGNGAVSVLCAQPSYNQRGLRAPKFEERNGVVIRRCWSTTHDPKKIWGRLLNFITTSCSIGCRALFLIKLDDKVLVVTNPPLLPFLVRVICWMKRAKFILLVHDVYPDVFVPLGILKPTSPIYKMMSWLNGKLYVSANHVVALGRDMARLISEKSKGAASVSVISNWGNVDVIEPQTKQENALLQMLGLECKFVINYSGNHGRTHDLLTLVEAANKLQDEDAIHFLFIGEGSGKAEAVARVKALGLVNVTFRAFADRSELNISLNASDVSVLAFKKHMEGISVPSRLYNLMAAGKPILAVVDNASEVADVVREANIGVTVPPESPQLLAEQILRLKNDTALRNQMALNSRKEVLNKYSYSEIKQQYRDLFDSL
ncbi:MAG: glycosyltransferase family 4 protein [Puniceicoccaceae bacterium]|nr:glycosyltransferase family 4 protein [Puniceicoccaceae bacterium]